MKHLKVLETLLTDINPSTGTSDGNTKYNSILPYHEWDVKLRKFHNKVKDEIDISKEKPINKRKRRSQRKNNKKKS